MQGSGDSGEILYHDDALFGIFAGWLAGLSPEAFPDLLPVLRRTFGTFEAPLRRNLGERTCGASAVDDKRAVLAPWRPDLDADRAAGRWCCCWSKRGCWDHGGTPS